mmetsp:Transcript_115578/g.265357  ORF Transcript_115578/g.265357 Transcript_115578/m.265357 type:complete len:325 (+) Transcript_115578:75-1049(+)|eukprot:CAMPEP_0204274298 /NCGR_PEP_ID=MMETSP0468-20130131/25109_1 /ASSEMBLY_ACC=CAM_ASM_000383 /TAXON_ID=2969 /ORGANISM="Oxyrrhis marina" /LENGTH=324 /DNA_ID=CAMNT_0051250493 /DNA_START=43 /DNA_END=1017 /DNA_ORIENTATION=-
MMLSFTGNNLSRSDSGMTESPLIMRCMSPLSNRCSSDVASTVGTPRVGSVLEHSSDTATEVSFPLAAESVIDDEEEIEPAVHIKNTFIHVSSAPFLDPSKFQSAPGGLDLEFLLAAESTTCSTSSRTTVRWADVMDDEDCQPQEKTVSEVILEHLRAASGGALTLSALGSRIPKKLVDSLQGMRLSDFVSSLPGVTVENSVARLSGISEAAEETVVWARGEFVQKIQDGEVSTEDVSAVAAVLVAVHHLIWTSDQKQQSTFALGNWLPPNVRAFLKSRCVRLLELLKEFPEVFVCSMVGTKPVISVVSCATPTEAVIRSHRCKC